MKIQLLLNQIAELSKKYDEIYRYTGAHFNIFSIAHIESDEVTVCRIIKELIDPKGTHYQGAAYLKLFMEHVLDIADFEETDLENAIVEREKTISGMRRIDLFIKLPNKIAIPIEVKLYAGDQNAQCFDYYKYAYNSKLYYLTLDGQAPSAESSCNLEESDIKSISFGKEIITWLSACLNLPATIRLAPIREIIIQFIDTLRKLTYQTEDKMEQEILKLLLTSKENFKSADLLANSLKAAEQKIFDRVYRELDQRIRAKYDFDLDDDSEVEEYDKYGIYYPIKKLDHENTLWLGVSCNHTMYADFALYDSNEELIEWKNHISQNSIISGTWESDNYSIAWEHLGHGLDEFPNFKHHNEAFYSLLESDGFNLFIEESMKTIDELMDSLRESLKIPSR